MWILFQDRQGTTNYKVHGSDLCWGGGGGGGWGNHLTDQTFGSLQFYFVVQILPFIDLTCSVCQWGVYSHSLNDTEFASRSSVQLLSSHQQAITCSIGVQLFCARWHGDVAKIRTALEKCKIYTKFCNEHEPWVYRLRSPPRWGITIQQGVNMSGIHIANSLCNNSWSAIHMAQSRDQPGVASLFSKG